MTGRCDTCATARTAHYPRPCELCAGYAKPEYERAVLA